MFLGEKMDAGDKGFDYNSLKGKGNIQGGKLMIKELSMDAPWMQMVSQGEIDPINQKMDLTLVLSPLRNVDRIISHIPIVRYILGGTLIAIPVRVMGDLKDPKIIPLDPSAVGSELLGVLKRTLSLPFKLIQPVTPRRGK
jgi:hypothetical protein